MRIFENSGRKQGVASVELILLVTRKSKWQIGEIQSKKRLAGTYVSFGEPSNWRMTSAGKV
ncbi:hypothetical protein GCM10008986_09430 [Salinibacillus aidingensis]|uniref:Uncharacterized protein n=1 Tax=Salinibacillus aidingensis TaxID=237684 RepID=A0ABN1AXX6_9BACI